MIWKRLPALWPLTGNLIRTGTNADSTRWMPWRLEDIWSICIGAIKRAVSPESFPPSDRFFGFWKEITSIAGIPPKQGHAIPVYLPVDDMFRLLDSIDTGTLLGKRNRAIFETMYSGGMRVSELAGLNIMNVDLDKGTARVFGKGSKERIVPLGRCSHLPEAVGDQNRDWDGR